MFDLASLQHGEKARCSRCNHLLSCCHKDIFIRTQAYAIAGLVFLVIACSFPFLSFQYSGVESVMTLPQTAYQLYLEGMSDLSLLVAGFILILPALELFLLTVFSYALAHGHYQSGLKRLGRIIFTLRSWSMVEVFFIGVLVSLVKIAKMATVIVGISFWAYAAFSICFTLALASLDRLQSWRRIEEISRD